MATYVQRWFYGLLILIAIAHDGNGIFCGQRAKQGDFKYVVAIRPKGRVICGGAIIDATHILTAGHCMDVLKANDEVFVIAGSVNLWKIDEAVARRVVDRKVHLQYQKHRNLSKMRVFLETVSHTLFGTELPRFGPKHDIAVLKLESALPLGGDIAVINLPDSDLLSYGETCVTAGWGRTHYGRTNRLYWTTLTTMDQSQCLEKYVDMDDNQLWAIDSKEESCMLTGDSGSPLVCNDVLVGVTSTSELLPKRPTLFVRVYSYLEFIKEAMQN